jgi:uncharacterized protein YbaA (DUF1428 family)
MVPSASSHAGGRPCLAARSPIFRKAVNAQEGEEMVFSWIVWPDKATQDDVHSKIWVDARMESNGPMPFERKRMI